MDVYISLEAGLAAATILPLHVGKNSETTQLRIAFDGDAVSFSDESKHIYKEYGLKAFTDKEQQAANDPLRDGPLKIF